MSFPRLPALPAPPLLVTGPDCALRHLTRHLLAQTGYVVREGTARQGTKGDSATVIVCPDATDATGLLALSALLGAGELTENNAYVFVVSGDVAPLSQALQRMRGRLYAAIIRRPVSLEALTRQVALAERWLQLAPPIPPITLLHPGALARRKQALRRTTVGRSSRRAEVPAHAALSLAHPA